MRIRSRGKTKLILSVNPLLDLRLLYRKRIFLHIVTVEEKSTKVLRNVDVGVGEVEFGEDADALQLRLELGRPFFEPDLKICKIPIRRDPSAEEMKGSGSYPRCRTWFRGRIPFW